MTDAEQAEQLHQEAMTLSDEGADELALEKYFAALRLDPARPSTHYNIGLLYKYLGRWRESFDHNQRATELSPEDEASNWNLAIAATALRDWQTARAVWNRLALPIELGDTPIEKNFGTTPVRLNRDDGAEVVWARRIDPVRARLISIPLPESGFRYSDLLLHDGAPVGYRLDSNGKERVVFDALELFERSRYATFEAQLVAPAAADIDALYEMCAERDLPVEDWTSSVRYLCKACSEGRPHDSHEHAPVEPEEWNPSRRIGLAAINAAAVKGTLHGWAIGERRIEGVEVMLTAV